MESSEDVSPLCAPLAWLAGSVGGRIFAGGRRRGKEVTTAAFPSSAAALSLPTFSKI